MKKIIYNFQFIVLVAFTLTIFVGSCKKKETPEPDPTPVVPPPNNVLTSCDVKYVFDLDGYYLRKFLYDATDPRLLKFVYEYNSVQHNQVENSYQLNHDDPVHRKRITSYQYWQGDFVKLLTSDTFFYNPDGQITFLHEWTPYLDTLRFTHSIEYIYNSNGTLDSTVSTSEHAGLVGGSIEYTYDDSLNVTKWTSHDESHVFNSSEAFHLSKIHYGNFSWLNVYQQPYGWNHAPDKDSVQYFSTKYNYEYILHADSANNLIEQFTIVHPGGIPDTVKLYDYEYQCFQ